MEFGSLVTDDFCEFVEMGRFGRPDKGAAISMVWRTNCLESAASSRWLIWDELSVLLRERLEGATT